ncbi:MAG: FAD:protein FMN transferase [Rhodopirellula sp.]|nr:FAD:protein FMN transferase [Rhodopirellula sp.]
MSDRESSSRREFLAGKSLRSEVEDASRAAGDALLGALNDRADAGRNAGERAGQGTQPEGGETLRLETRAMACEFSVIMNPGEHQRMWVASDALELVHRLEQQMTVYRDDSELSQINRQAPAGPVSVEPGLFALLLACRELVASTDGTFDPTSGPLIALWRRCRDAGRIPTQEEIDECRLVTGIEHVSLDDEVLTVSYDRAGVELNLGGIGKGYALDCCARQLVKQRFDGFVMHGGRSSLLARGDHNGQGGWPVGIGNPLFTDKRLGTILLRDQAMSTSGSNIQYFRHEGRRYGHILDPRTGWPVDGTLSVTVVAPSAAVADALSTAFFVGGVEIARRCCDNLAHVGAVLIPRPERGRRVRPVVMGIPDDQIFWDSEQVELSSAQ